MAEIIVALGLFQRRCSNKAPLLLAHKSTFFAVASLTVVLQLLFLKGNNGALSKEADMANLSFL